MERRLAAIFTADVVGYSRLMGRDEAGTLAALKSCEDDVIAPKIDEHRGRIVKLMGDGLLAEFSSVIAAVQCALEIQAGLAQRNADLAEDRRIALRIGINLGDVIVEGEDIYGEGVNLAARLEEIAEPGGICLSEDAHRQARGKVEASFADLGQKTLKNIAEPVRVYGLVKGETARSAEEPRHRPRQEIRYCRAPDGVRIAYASVGVGPPLVKAANWLSHLEYDWESPVWRHWYAEIAKTHRLIRYDGRANGLSDWDVEVVSFEGFVNDLEAVTAAAGLEKFALLGISQGCAASIAYTVRHSERVSALVLYGGYAAGWGVRGDKAEIERRLALRGLIQVGWGQNNPAYRQVFSTLFAPGATEAQMASLNELERLSTSPENAVRIFDAFGDIDVRDLLPQVRVPTLVLHAREDAMVPFESGRDIAKNIANARFVPLESRNHILLEQEPAWAEFLAAMRGFLSENQA